MEGAGRPEPRAWLWAVGLACAALLAVELWLRPGFAIGDETLEFRRSLDWSFGAPFAWQWGQASLHRAAAAAWLLLSRPHLAAVHLPGYLYFGLELLFLARLSRRWAGPGHAGWAVVAALLSAQAWMRARSLLGLQWAPMLLLGLALLSARVRGRATALFWGLLAAPLLMEYEGAFMAAPFLWMACRAHEEGFRRHAAWAAAGFAAGTLGLGLLARSDWAHYAGTRAGIYLGSQAGALLAALGSNLKGVLLGGLPMPYFGVDHWPLLAPWTWPALVLGLGPAWRRWRWALFWAAALLLGTQATRNPWGLPAHRLAGLAPAAAWIAGLGLRRLWNSGRAAQGLALALLAFGLVGEGNAWYRHMAVHGRQLFGRSGLQADAAEAARSLAARGMGVQTALYETERTEFAWFCRPREAREGMDRVLFVPPELRRAALAAGLQAQVFRESLNDEPLLLLRVPPAQAARFDALEHGLRALEGPPGEAPGPASERDRRWLRSSAPADPWAFAMVLDRDLRRAWQGLDVTADHLRWAGRADLASPAPLATLGRFYRGKDPVAALQLLDRALRLDPAYSPALEERVKVLEDRGSSPALDAARAARWRAAEAGAWQVYD